MNKRQRKKYAQKHENDWIEGQIKELYALQDDCGDLNQLFELAFDNRCKTKISW